MSLILDALKKLEREKQTTPRGFLVVAPGPWAGHGRGATLVVGSLAVGLVLGAVGLAAYGRMSPTEEETRARAGAGAPAATTLAPLPAALPTSGPAPSEPIRIARTARAGTGVSPAPSPSTAPASDGSLDGPRLQAISEQDGHPVAVIDERLVHEGDLVDGMKILRIGAAEVEIEHRGRRRLLRF